MDSNQQMEKLTRETTELRKEVWKLKEMITQQNAIIIKHIKEQRKLLEDHLQSNAEKPAKSVLKPQSQSQPQQKPEPEPEPESEPKPEPESESESESEWELKPKPGRKERISKKEHLKHLLVFPISTQTALDKTEQQINSTNAKAFINTAKILLEPDGLKKNVSRIFSDDIILNYNVGGSHNKGNIKDYPKLLNVLYRATLKEGWTQKTFLDELRLGFKRKKNCHHKNRSVMKKSLREKMDMEPYNDDEDNPKFDVEKVYVTES